jgi:membrane associated rhomboid family serine protease
VLTLVLNLAITFIIPGISIGAHIGGIIAGGIGAVLLFEVGERQRGMRTAALAVTVLLGVLIAAACILYSRSEMGL